MTLRCLPPELWLFVLSPSRTPCGNSAALKEMDLAFLGHHHPGFFQFLEQPILSDLRTLLEAFLSFSCSPRSTDLKTIPRSPHNENITTSEEPSLTYGLRAKLVSLVSLSPATWVCLLVCFSLHCTYQHYPMLICLLFYASSLWEQGSSLGSHI